MYLIVNSQMEIHCSFARKPIDFSAYKSLKEHHLYIIRIKNNPLISHFSVALVDAFDGLSIEEGVRVENYQDEHVIKSDHFLLHVRLDGIKYVTTKYFLEVVVDEATFISPTFILEKNEVSINPVEYLLPGQSYIAAAIYKFGEAQPLEKEMQLLVSPQQYTIVVPVPHVRTITCSLIRAYNPVIVGHAHIEKIDKRAHMCRAVVKFSFDVSTVIRIKCVFTNIYGAEYAWMSDKYRI